MEIPNLDALAQDELRGFARTAARSAIPQPYRALLVAYAICRVVAMDQRIAGRIVDALASESRAERRDYLTAIKQAQANAKLDNRPRFLWSYGGVYWVEPNRPSLAFGSMPYDEIKPDGRINRQS